MALRQFLSFDSFPQGGATGITAATFASFYPGGSSYDSNGGGLLFSGAGQAPTGAAITTGWIKGTYYSYSLAGNGAGGCSCIGFPLSTLSDGVSRATYIGFRYSRTAASFGPGVILNNSANTYLTILPLAALAAGQIAYVEMMIDRVNKLLTIWIDGVQYSSAFFDYTAYANGADTTLWFGTPYNYGYPGGFSANWFMRDFYSIDDTQDATLCSRLGPVDVRPAALNTVVAPNWTSSDSQSPIADLGTPFTNVAGTWSAPTQTESPGMDPLLFTFSNAGIVGSERILALKADITAYRPGGYQYSPQISVGFNGQSVQAKKMVYPTPNAFVNNQNAFLLEKAPDGTVWTPQSMQAAVATLTP